MKLNGKKLVTRNKKTLTLTRSDGNGSSEEVKLTVTCLPMGWMERMVARGMYNYPDPPTTPVKDKKSGKLIVNPVTKKVEFKERLTDPEYVRACNAMSRRLVALKLHAHLVEDTSVEWETPEPSPEAQNGEWGKFADGLLRAIEEAGFTDEEISTITNLGETLACVADIDEAVNDFLPHSEEEDESEVS